MSKATKLWLITAAALIFIGLLIFGGVMMELKWNFANLFTVKCETNTHEISENFTDLSIITDTADIAFLPAEDGQCKVVCHEEAKAKHTVSVEDGILSIRLVDDRKWYEHIGIGFEPTKVTVYLPEAAYGSLLIKESTGDIDIAKDLSFESMDITVSTGDVVNRASASGMMKIKASTGDIHVENVAADSLDLSVSTGDITASGVTCVGDVTVKVSTGKAYLTDVTCQDLTTTGNTGDLSLTKVVATGKFSIERSTGDVKFDACDAAEIFVKTDTGNIKGSLLSEKVFIYHSNTGKIDLPQTTSGGKCEINTDTGDIKITIG